jgi:spermidine export protein MdtJ
MLYYWMFMLVAIISEVIGVLAMKFSAIGSPKIGLAIMYVMLAISYGSLAIAVKRIPIAVAYGTWESLGLVLISLFSALLFAEPLSLMKVVGIVTIIAGILLLETGTDESEHASEGVPDTSSGGI